jgi:hypothetical protein
MKKHLKRKLLSAFALAVFLAGFFTAAVFMKDRFAYFLCGILYAAAFAVTAKELLR